MFASSRTQGVVTSTSMGPKEFGPGKTVESIIRLEQYLVKFYDESGTAHVDVLVRVGDAYYANPFGEEWCARLGVVQKWLGDVVHKRIEAKNKGVDASAIPTSDAVNITGSRISAATKEVVERLR